MPKRIAVVEDEPALRENYADLFRRHGYQVDTYDSRTAAQQAFESRLPDLAILDIGLGDEIDGGFELCRALRERNPALPIIFLSARDSDFDVVAGLRLGADDYLTKDVSLHQLTARIAALFRRVDAMRERGDVSEALTQGPLQIDLERLTVLWKEQPVALTVTELWMLHSLAKRPGHVKSREQLMEAADIFVDLATISSHIKRIRRKFEQIDPDFDAIESVYGAGYRYNVE